MEYTLRSDLAAEAFPRGGLSPDSKHEREDHGGFTVERLHLSERDARRIEKPAGHYTTVSFRPINDLTESESTRLASFIAGELSVFVSRAAEKPIDGKLSLLVAGLGNSEITPDAIGPGTIARLNATRHLATADPHLFTRLGCCRVSAIAPGVLGQTGIEASEIVGGAAAYASPDVIIAIDALAARARERLNATVQISDVGISPGSGIGNRRSELSRRTLGVPVIALGVPTVVDSATLVLDVLGKAGITDPSDGLRRVLDGSSRFFVAPKDCDAMTRAACRLLASALNRAFGIDLGPDA